jgi:hypothetical protein
MLFDCGDADFKLKSFVDFVLFELGQLGVETIYLPSEIGLDAVDLCVELVDAGVEAGDVVFRRHVLDDMGEHFTNLLKGDFLGCHIRKSIAYHHFQRSGEIVGDGFAEQALGGLKDGLDLDDGAKRPRTTRGWILPFAIKERRIGMGFSDRPWRETKQSLGGSRRMTAGAPGCRLG